VDEINVVHGCASNDLYSQSSKRLHLLFSFEIDTSYEVPLDGTLVDGCDRQSLVNQQEPWSKKNIMRSKRASSSSTKDESSSSGGDTKSITSLSSSTLKQRAADMIANGVDLSTFGEPKPDANTLAEIREGAERVAYELDDYLQNNETSHTYISPFRQWKGVDGKIKPNLTDDEIVDLQLSIARKLREVRTTSKQNDNM
jgi:hypothetical protein